MYSYDDRIRAVWLYIQYDNSAAAVIEKIANSHVFNKSEFDHCCECRKMKRSRRNKSTVYIW